MSAKSIVFEMKTKDHGERSLLIPRSDSKVGWLVPSCSCVIFVSLGTCFLFLDFGLL